jgi:replicative DNA helicase
MADTVAHEQEILSIIINDPSMMDDVFSEIRPEDFTHPAHVKLADYCLLLGDKLGAVSLGVAIDDNEAAHLCGGPGYVKSLAEMYISTGLDQLIEIVRKKALKKKLSEFGKGLEGVDPDNIDKVEAEFFRIIEGGVSGKYDTLADGLPEFVTSLELKMNGKKSEVQAGFAELDRVLGELHSGNLIIIGGRPGQGKTSLALNILYNVSIFKGLPVGFFSLEMSKDELTGKLISRHTNIPAKMIRDGIISPSDFGRIGDAIGVFQEAKFFIDDTPGLNLYKIRSKARRMVRAGAKLIVVDYLQLVGGQDKGQGRVEFVGQVSSGLKNLARECQVPVIALAQLNRSNEYTKNSKPELHHLRESGSIEQDADSVVFIHRPDQIENPEVAEFIIAKNRHGECRVLDYKFKGAQGHFTEWQAGEKPEDKPEGKK